MHLHPKLNAFIEQKRSELKERPAIAASTFGFGPGQLIGSLPNPTQVLQCYGPVVGPSLPDHPVADGVVHIGLESSLTSTQPLQGLPASSASRPCAFGRSLLQRGSYLAELVSNECYLFATEFLSLRSHSDIRSAQVDSENLYGILNLRRLRTNLNLQIISAIGAFAKRCSLWVNAFQQSSLIVANVQPELLPAFHHGQCDRPVCLSKRKSAAVIGGTGRGKTFNRLILPLRRLPVGTDSPNGMNGQLRGKARFSSRSLVNQRLNRYLIGQVLWGIGIHILTAFSKLNQHGLKFFNLVRQYIQLAANRKDLGHFQLVKFSSPSITSCSQFIPHLLREEGNPCD